jgi:transcriptional regulator with XRE-family HTH domain
MYLVPEIIEMSESLSDSSLALRIKSLRLKLNMSQERFGKKVGISGKTVSAYERGTCVPPLRILENVSKVYGVTIMATDNTKQTILSTMDKLHKLLNEISENLV